MCGGRTWGYARWDAPEREQRKALAERAQTFRVLDYLDQMLGFDAIIHGDAQGADRVSGLWADHNCISVDVYPADWHRLGRKAGPMRNSQMIAEGNIHLGVAFPGGVGTDDMKFKLEAAGIDLLDFAGLQPLHGEML